MKLKPHEALYLWRRRIWFTQRQLAKREGYSVDEYIRRELNIVPLEPHLKQLCGADTYKPTPEECCTIWRRRLGLSQEAIAEQVGCSRYWVGQMELGNVDSAVRKPYCRVYL